jgi:O-antigen biosynthesis protein
MAKKGDAMPGDKPFSGGRLARAGLGLVRHEGIGALLFKVNETLNRSVGASGIPLVEAGDGPGQRLTVKGKLAGTLRFPADRLNRIDVMTERGSAGLSGIRLSIVDDEGKIIRKASVAGGQVKDGGFTAFRFSPIENSKGRSFTYILEPLREGQFTLQFDHARGSGSEKITSDGREYRGSARINAYARLGRKRAYDIWIMKNEPDGARLRQCREESDRYPFRPKISIITPVYNPDPAWVRAAVESVTGQAYTNWELCIADASTREDVKQLLSEYAAEDSRIKLRFTENLGISGNSNVALAEATGDFVAFLDHDDELSPDALYEVARLLQADPGADIIYSDEDFISPSGVRIFPSFKPDWSPDLFLSGMYICHLAVYRKSLVGQAGQLRKEYDGAQDYDLALRCIEKARAIRHIPRVLYHFRQSAGSTSLALGNKEYADVAAIKALGDYMRRNGIAGEATRGLWPGSYRIRRTIDKTHKVSIIVYASGGRHISRCIESILRTTQHCEILLIDDSPRHDLEKALEKDGLTGKVTVIGGGDGRGRPQLSDAAARSARGDILVFLGGDIEAVNDGWLEPMLEQVQRKEVGAVGCKLIYKDGRVQHAGLIIGMDHDGIPGIAGHMHRLYPEKQHGYCGRIGMIQDLSAVTADCLMIRKDVYDIAGGFDNGLKNAFHDIDLCLRLRQAGYLVVYTPFAVLRRQLMPGGPAGTLPDRSLAGDAGTIRKRWDEVIRRGDPYFSSNLSLEYEDIRIRL